MEIPVSFDYFLQLMSILFFHKTAVTADTELLFALTPTAWEQPQPQQPSLGVLAAAKPTHCDDLRFDRTCNIIVSFYKNKENLQVRNILLCYIHAYTYIASPLNGCLLNAVALPL